MRANRQSAIDPDRVLTGGLDGLAFEISHEILLNQSPDELFDGAAAGIGGFFAVQDKTRSIRNPVPLYHSSIGILQLQDCRRD